MVGNIRRLVGISGCRLRVDFEYRSLMNRIKSFHESVLGSRQMISRATNLNGPLAGRSLSFFCTFDNLPRAFTYDLQFRTISNTSLDIKNQ